MTILATFWHLTTVNMAIFGKSKTHYSSWNVSKPLLSVAPCCLHSSSCCWKRRTLSGQNVWLETARSRFGCFAGRSTSHHHKAYFSIDVLTKYNVLWAAYKSCYRRCFTRELFVEALKNGFIFVLFAVFDVTVQCWSLWGSQCHKAVFLRLEHFMIWFRLLTVVNYIS